MAHLVAWSAPQKPQKRWAPMQMLGAMRPPVRPAVVQRTSMAAASPCAAAQQPPHPAASPVQHPASGARALGTTFANRPIGSPLVQLGPNPAGQGTSTGAQLPAAATPSASARVRFPLDDDDEDVASEPTIPTSGSMQQQAISPACLQQQLPSPMPSPFAQFAAAPSNAQPVAMPSSAPRPAAPTRTPGGAAQTSAGPEPMSQAPQSTAPAPTKRRELHVWLVDALNRFGMDVRSTADKQFRDVCPDRIKKSAKLKGKMFISERVRVDPTVGPPPKGTTPTQYALQPHEWQRMMMLADDLGITLQKNKSRDGTGS